MENKVLYITQSWTLSRKDHTLFFENESTKKVIPIANIEQIYCLGEISINSKLLQFLTSQKISLHFFNYYGYYSWTYYPKESYVSGKLLTSQVLAYEDENKRVIIAKSLVQGIWENILETLFHYRRHNKDVDAYINNIQENIIILKRMKTIQQIMSIEWAIWSTFYDSFKEFIHKDFILNKRVRRPPDNPINALISFWNSVLYTYTLSKIYHTQLNPTIAYLHEPFERRFSLALDLSEVFKIPLVFSTIFNLVNKNILQVEKHFMKEINYASLNEEGRKVFMKYWDEKLEKTIDHPILKRKVSYGSLIKLDAYKLIKYLLWENLFIPFSLKSGF